jgi:hypothetical protein
MLPAFVDRFETVAIWIEDVRGVIAGIVVEARAGSAIVSRAGGHRSFVERVYLGLALGDKADMSSPRIRIALPEPEENATVSSKALEVGMSFGTVLTVVIDDMRDAERLEGRLVEGNRPIGILDGYEDVVEQEFTSFVNRFTQPAFPLSNTATFDRQCNALRSFTRGTGWNRPTSLPDVLDTVGAFQQTGEPLLTEPWSVGQHVLGAQPLDARTGEQHLHLTLRHREWRSLHLLLGIF